MKLDEPARISAIDIDKTGPVITFSGNLGSYLLTDIVDITCAATDALSGIDSAVCPEAHGPGHAFAVAAPNVLEASATDLAGNSTTASTEFSIEAAGAKSLGSGDVATLGSNIIHSVLNPIGKMTCALHVYGGDFFEPEEPRSEWDHETLQEQAWDIDRVRTLFARADARFHSVGH